MQIFKNKFFIICLGIAIVLSAVLSVFSMMGYKSLTRDAVGILVTPFRWCGRMISNGIDGFSRYFQSLEALQESKESLENENRELKDQLQRAEILEAENKRLRSYLGILQEHPTFVMEEGMVLSQSSGNYATGYTLNRGTLHGVTVNMTVITPEGIVGYVSEVGSTWCRVSTLLETAASVGAYLPRSGVTGIVSGDFTMSHQGVCKFSYMEADADIQVGDLVYSSGTGSIYPADLLIGEVVSIDVDEYSRSVIATVRPAVEFSDLQYMLIIKGYQE
ncbi:MAG: rod shape-determining protein MreC [Clostridia bacterium]|nr:rod shape-determining protein MreC [Clostridia bacterium]